MATGGVANAAAPSPTAAGDQLADIQRAHIVEVLRRERGNKARTARALGVNRRTLYRLLEKHGISLQDDANPVGSASGAVAGGA
jgi:DNA-binding NtrC family response regulator